MNDDYQRKILQDLKNSKKLNNILKNEDLR